MMTTEEAIKHGKDQLEIFGGTHKEFIKCALDSIQKLQKIEQLLNTEYLFSHAEVIKLQDIMDIVRTGRCRWDDGVVEDGNN